MVFPGENITVLIREGGNVKRQCSGQDFKTDPHPLIGNLTSRNLDPIRFQRLQKNEFFNAPNN